MNWVGLIVALLGIAAVATGLFRAFWPVAPGPAYRELDNPGRGELERRIRRTSGDPGEDLRLLRTAAEIMVAQRNLLGVWLGCFLIQFGTALADWNSVHLLITVLFAMAIGALALYFERRAEAGAVFLAGHPVPDQPRPDPGLLAELSPAPSAEAAATPRTQPNPSSTEPVKD